MIAPQAPAEPAMRAAFERATLLRLLSVAFQPPAAGRRDELRALAATVPAPFLEEARALAAQAEGGLEEEYHRVLGASGACPDCESDYVAGAALGKGTLLADVAGFYGAFRFDPSEEIRVAPDHVAVELGFLGWLAVKEAYARGEGQADAEKICREAACAFLRDHVGSFAPSFFERLEATAAVGFYAAAARMGARAVAALRGETEAAWTSG